MKANVCGVKRMAGTAKGSGNAYEMCNISVLVAVEQVNNPKMQINGAGFDTMELPLDVAALPQFMNLKYPMQMTLLTDVRMRAGKPQTVVTGFEPVKAAA